MESHTFLTVFTFLKIIVVICLLILGFSLLTKRDKSISMCFDKENNVQFIGYTKYIPKFKKRNPNIEVECFKSSMTARDWQLLKQAKNKGMIFK